MSETEILGFTRHPASAVWPDLGENEYAALLENIRDQGQDHPILATADKRVIDGWHRLRACAEIDIKPVTVTAHFSEEEIARKVIGAHTGRRHMTQIEIARLTVETMKACGMEHAASGDRRNAEEGSQGDSPPPKVITRETVAKDAGVSRGTAMRAIREDKRKSGLLPKKPAPAKREEAEAAPAPERGGGDKDASSAAEGASKLPEAPSNGAEAPSSPANGVGSPAPETPTERTDAVAGDPDPSRMEAIRRAVAQLQDGDPADDAATLDDEQVGEFAAIGQQLVEIGLAIIKAAGHRTTGAAAVASAAPGTPSADDPAFDIPPFLDRRGDASQGQDG